MKVINKPIDMICWFTKEGEVQPLKFQITNKNGKDIMIEIGHIINKNISKIAGQVMLCFTCQSKINGIERLYEIRYVTSNNKWFLYKI